MKFFLVLSLCSVAAFIMVLRLRPPVGSVRPGVITTSTPAEADSKAAAAKQATRSSAARRTSAASVSTESINPAPFGAEQPIATSVENPIPVPRPGYAQVIVTSETAALYATNSSKSPVVRILQKGERVETDLNVTDSEGTWSLIRVPEQRVSGYIRNQNIERTRLADTSSRY